jgi:type I restriction enzyme, S subunit
MIDLRLIVSSTPKDWVTYKIAHGFGRIGSGTTPKSDSLEYYDGDIPWITTSELRENLISEARQLVTQKAMRDYSVLKYYPEGTLLIALYGATIGRMGILGLPATVNQACCALSEPTKFDTKFVYYWLWAFRPNLISLSSGGGQPNLSQEIIKSIRIPCPGIKLQQKIAYYLDNKTTQIDALIAKKQRQIELLKEKRAALITQAVTKGLDPNVKMKDSGVEWIGQMPDNWTVSRMDREVRVKARLGWRGLKAEEYVDEGYIFLSTPNIKPRFIDFDNVNYINEHRYLESPEIMLNVGDVLLAKDGSTLGICNVVRHLPSPTTVNSSIAVLRPTNGMNAVYLYFFLSSSYFQAVINSMKGGMGVPHLFQADINKLQVFTPPLDEQNLIAQYLDGEMDKFGRLLDKLNNSIELLIELRSSLISEAVTGKLSIGETS